MGGANPTEKATGGIIRSRKANRPIENIHLIWEADLNLRDDKGVIKSQTYCSGYKTPEEVKWRMILDPNFVDKTGTKYLSLYLEMIDSAKDIKASINISLMNGFFRQYVQVSGLSTFESPTSSVGFQKYIASHCIPKGEAFLRFEARINILERKGKSLVYAEPDKEKTPEPVNFDFNAAITVGDEITLANSQRLSFHSSVLQKHLSKKSTKSEPFDATKFCKSKKTIEAMVTFCHTGRIPLNTAEVIDLLKLSRDLDMPILKKKCESAVLQNLTVNTYVRTVKLARDGHAYFSNKDRADKILINFLIENFEEIRDNVEFIECFEEISDYFIVNLMLNDSDGGEDDATNELDPRN